MKRIIMLLVLLSNFTHAELEVGPYILIYSATARTSDGSTYNKIKIHQLEVHQEDGFKYIDFDGYAPVKVKITKDDEEGFIANYIPSEENSDSYAYVFSGTKRRSDEGWTCTLSDYSTFQLNEGSRDVLMFKERGSPTQFIMYPVRDEKGSPKAK